MPLILNIEALSTDELMRRLKELRNEIISRERGGFKSEHCTSPQRMFELCIEDSEDLKKEARTIQMELCRRGVLC